MSGPSGGRPLIIPWLHNKASLDDGDRHGDGSRDTDDDEA